jgi:cell division septum initiation protein DivIVA
MKGRVKGLHRETFPDEERAMEPPGDARAEPPEQTDAHPVRDVQRQALQMLTLAQRTGEEHVAGALRQADKIQADARATAEHLVRDAQAQADAVRREAGKALSDARAGAAQIATDAQAHADHARRDGDKIVSDAQAQAAQITKDAQASADELKRQAQQRYEEMVGNLAAKREALQQQIEALQEFDRDYRARLVTFLQAQLRALWVDQPHVEAEIEQPGAAATTRLLPPQQPNAGATTGFAPAPDQDRGGAGSPNEGAARRSDDAEPEPDAANRPPNETS